MGGASYVVVAAALVGASALGCRWPVDVNTKPGAARRCEGDVCLQVVSFQSHRETIGVWVDAPPDTLLVNAHVAIDAELPCGGHFPVAWVKVDRALYRSGPTRIDGSHGLVLGFPMNTWWDHSGYWQQLFVDVEIAVRGQGARCLRMRLTNADGSSAVAAQ
jgi:hypothetical protein